MMKEFQTYLIIDAICAATKKAYSKFVMNITQSDTIIND